MHSTSVLALSLCEAASAVVADEEPCACTHHFHSFWLAPPRTDGGVGGSQHRQSLPRGSSSTFTLIRVPFRHHFFSPGQKRGGSFFVFAPSFSPTPTHHFFLPLTSRRICVVSVFVFRWGFFFSSAYYFSNKRYLYMPRQMGMLIELYKKKAANAPVMEQITYK